MLGAALVSAEVEWAGTGRGVVVPLSWLWSVAPRGPCWDGDAPALTPVRVLCGLAHGWVPGRAKRAGIAVRTWLAGMFGGLLAADGSWFRATPLFCVDFGHTDVP